jgi:uncharacterized C2H2 Zn-finger protein
MEILSCPECDAILLQDMDYIDCGLYKCPKCGKIVDADYEDLS